MAKAALAPVTNYRWNLLPNSPVATSRTDDIWFLDELTGWLVNQPLSVCEGYRQGGDQRMLLGPTGVPAEHRRR